MHHLDTTPANAHGVVIMGLPEGASAGEAREPLYGPAADEAMRTMPSGTLVVAKGNRLVVWDGTATPAGILAWPKSSDGAAAEGPARIRFMHRQSKGVMENVVVPAGVSREVVLAALGPAGINLLAA